MRTKNWFAPSNYSPFTVSSNEKERTDTDLDNDFSSETNSRERLHQPHHHAAKKPVSPLQNKLDAPLMPKQNGGLFVFDLSNQQQQDIK